ncbi:MAG: T9SS type A sorting domain-containing protein, partial [Candidatus Krumholzibacteria bacterium]|nr:T9SS type A sorting domain-containing protein [Candidatus Krumholzibacteria bacterium]
GSGSAGEYRGIPNLVFKSGQPQNSYFHPGFTNANSRVVSAGPLKVTVASESDNPNDLWQVLWEFYPTCARMTVQTVGATNDGKYWFLYEGTMGGAMDANDVVVRSTGAQTSAFDYADSWEEVLPDPGWVYFHDQDASRILFLGHDLGDGEMDSYRPQGQSSGSTPEMTVFGFGRVLNTSPDKLVPRISGAGQTFTLGLMGDQTDPAVEIAAASEPLIVTVGSPSTEPSGVGDANVPATAVLNQNFPNPFNPRTMITFTLPASSRVRLDILDLQGRRVANLMDGTLPEGPHSVMFDGKELPSGIYISRLVSDGISQERKMMLIR